MPSEASLSLDTIIQAAGLETSVERPCAWHLLDVVDSTNSWLKNAGALEGGDDAVCIAARQVAGRGRRDRRWLSSDQALSLSVSSSLRVDAGMPAVSIALACACAQMLEQLGARQIRVKWPNDLFHRGRKLGGILVESALWGPRARVIAGLGINLRGAPAGVDATDLEAAMQPLPAASVLVGSLAGCLLRTLRAWSGNCASWLPLWQAFDALAGQPLQVQPQDGASYEARARGIDEQGSLIVVDDRGRERSLHSDEVRLRTADGGDGPTLRLKRS